MRICQYHQTDLRTFLQAGIRCSQKPHLQTANKDYGKDSFSSKVLLYCYPTTLELYGKQYVEK